MPSSLRGPFRATIEMEARGGGSQGLILSPVRRVPRPLPLRSAGPQAQVAILRTFSAAQPVPGCGSPASCRCRRRHRAAAEKPRGNRSKLASANVSPTGFRPFGGCLNPTIPQKTSGFRRYTTAALHTPWLRCISFK